MHKFGPIPLNFNKVCLMPILTFFIKILSFGIFSIKMLVFCILYTINGSKMKSPKKSVNTFYSVFSEFYYICNVKKKVYTFLLT